MIDEQGETRCDACGKVLRMGEHPMCSGDGKGHGLGINGRVHDEIPGGITLDNYGPQPVTFYSHSERRAYMKAHGLQEMDKFCPMPGTDIDPQGIPNPKGFMDPQTLFNAAELICRNGAKGDWDGEAAGVLKNLTIETVADARRVHDAVD